jgi:tellurium resistance protein TerZ
MAINLQKGQRISLEKTDGAKLQNICVGINWGAIEKKGLFGFGSTKEAVDLGCQLRFVRRPKKAFRGSLLR